MLAYLIHTRVRDFRPNELRQTRHICDVCGLGDEAMPALEASGNEKWAVLAERRVMKEGEQGEVEVWRAVTSEI